MKLIFAICSLEDAPQVQSSLTSANFIVTKLATTGGFLNAGNITFLTAVEEDKIDSCVEIIRQNSKKRTVDVSPEMLDAKKMDAASKQITVGGAIIFILNVEQFIKA